MNGSEKFLERLVSEKEIHKEHRHKHVIYKLTFVSTLFALGVFKTVDVTFLPLLYLVPFISLCHDLFIFAENYKVKRIGIFILSAKKNSDLSEEVKESISDLEIFWEKWVSDHRELWAYRSSLLLTAVVSVGAIIVIIYRIQEESSLSVYVLSISWFVLLILGTLIVFIKARALTKKIRTSYEEVLN